MRLWSRLVLIVICPFFALGQRVDAASNTAPMSAMEYQGLLRADLVVRGSLLSVENQLIPASELSSTWHGGGKCQISIVEMRVDEVLHGWYDENILSFIVDMSSSSLRGDYGVGDETIVSLRYSPEVRGGTFMSAGNSSRFVLDPGNNCWVRQYGDAAHLQLAQIRSFVAPARLDAVAASSSRIVTGNVIEAQRSLMNDPLAPNSSSYVWTVKMRVGRSLKGVATADGTVTFQMMLAGTYWPAWASPGPDEIEVGGEYCAFLKEIGGKTYCVGGTNGFFAIKQDRLVRNGLTLPVGVDAVKHLSEKAEVK